MDFTASQMYWFDKYIDKIIENNENQRLQIYTMEQEYVISNLALWAELSIVRKVGNQNEKPSNLGSYKYIKSVYCGAVGSACQYCTTF